MNNGQKGFIVTLDTLGMPQENAVKTEILYELEGTNYKIQDTSHNKCIYCPVGFCTITDTKNNQSVVLDSYDMNVVVNKDINLEITNYSDNVEIVISYFKDDVL